MTQSFAIKRTSVTAYQISQLSLACLMTQKYRTDFEYLESFEPHFSAKVHDIAIEYISNSIKHAYNNNIADTIQHLTLAIKILQHQKSYITSASYSTGHNLYHLLSNQLSILESILTELINPIIITKE